MALTGKQKRYLRSQGHNLNALVQIGKAGLTDELLKAIDQALLDHELIKVRVGRNSTILRKEAAEELAQRSSSEVAQILGSTILLYRVHPEEPKLRLPAAPKQPTQG